VKNRITAALIIFLLFCVGPSYACTCEEGVGTDVFGPIFENTTWTKDGSPYCITQSVTVLENITLTIEPGVVVKFWEGTETILDNKYNLVIQGQIVARGSESENIFFTSSLNTPNSGDWGYIELTNTSEKANFNQSGDYQNGSIFEHVVIEYGGGGDKSTVFAENSPYFNYTTLRHNKNRAIYFVNTAKVDNSTFSNNYLYSTVNGGGAIFSESSILIDGSSFDNNICSSTPNYSGGGAICALGDMQVKNSNFLNNTVYTYSSAWANARQVAGGAINSKSSLFLDNVNFENNSARTTYGYSYGGSVYVEESSIIRNTTFRSNTAYFIYGGSHGGAIYAKNNNISSRQSLEITDSQFTDNLCDKYPSVYPDGFGFGGAVFSELELTLSNCEIVGNGSVSTGSSSYGEQYDAKGGGIAFSPSYPNKDATILNSYFSNNFVRVVFKYNHALPNPIYIGEAYGGAIYGEDSIIYLNDSVLEGNISEIICENYTGYSYGSAVYETGLVSLSNCNITCNKSDKSSIHAVRIVMDKCLIHRNESQNSVYFSIGSLDEIITNTTIINNTGNGVYIEGSEPPIINGSNLFGNGGYDLYNNSVDDVNAKGNYWGTTNTGNIFLKIYDEWDDPSKGEVDFGLYDNSFLSSFASGAPPVPVTNGDINGDDTVNLSDAILLLQIVTDQNSSDIYLGADINEDNHLGLEEMTYILQEVSELR